MLVVAAVGAFYLIKTVPGRHVFAFGGNVEASRFAGLRLSRIQIGVFAAAGLTAGDLADGTGTASMARFTYHSLYSVGAICEPACASNRSAGRIFARTGLRWM